MWPLRRGGLGLAIVIGLGTSGASAQSFTGLGFLPGGTSSQAYAVSADGAVVVGQGDSSEGMRAFRWTAGTGCVSLGTLAGGTQSWGYGVSADGATVAGYSGPGSTSGTRAFRCTCSGAVCSSLADLGTLMGGTFTYGNGISGDGLVVVGYGNSSTGSHAFRSTGAGLQDIGTLMGGSSSVGIAANSDGSVVVGYSASSSGFRAFRWTAAGLQDLGTLPGQSASYAYAVSADGTVVVGHTFDGASNSGTAFRWNGGPDVVNLGTLPGDTNAFAYGVSGDGTVAVGISGSAGNYRAVLWSPMLTMVDLNAYLPTLGIDLTGWTLTYAYDISPDGQHICGYGIHNGATEAWRATLAPVAAVQIAAANPPLDDPFTAGSQPFRDVLQNTTPGLTPQGIGAPGTPGEGAVTYAPISVSFSGTPVPAPSPANITVSCTGGTCPTVTGVSGSGAGPYVLSLSATIPPQECVTFTFAGTLAGQKLQYQSLPGDVNLNGTTTGQDVVTLVSAINSGTAADPANLPRYDINRNGGVTGQDVIRLVQLLNGGVTVIPSTGYNGATVANCPP